MRRGDRVPDLGAGRGERRQDLQAGSRERPGQRARIYGLAGSTLPLPVTLPRSTKRSTGTGKRQVAAIEAPFRRSAWPARRALGD
jgi:hypothetical protein